MLEELESKTEQDIIGETDLYELKDRTDKTINREGDIFTHRHEDTSQDEERSQEL